jgi:hypothetical protein
MAIAKYSLQRIDEGSFEDIVKDILKKTHSKAFYYSAFLRKESVLELEELLKNEENFSAVIGVRNGTTSFQGLEALQATGVKLYVVDTGSAMTIFHAKSLLVVDEENNLAYAVFGSSNFTPGGFYRNIESNVYLELDLNNEEDFKFYSDFISCHENLVENNNNSDNVLLISDVSSINDFLLDGRVVDETKHKIKTSVGKSSISTDTIKMMKLQPIRKHSAKTSNKKVQVTDSLAEERKFTIATDSLLGTVKEVWKSKPLKERDLSIPSKPGTNPTGSMLMKRGEYNIDQQSYFYDEVFSNLKWSTQPSKKSYFQFADAKFHILIEGIEFGSYTLTLKYDERTDTTSYKQSQPNVSLSWGEAGSVIKNPNLLGKTMFLYRVEDKVDEYLIEIKDGDGTN